MATTHQVRSWWAEYRCDVGEVTTVLGHSVRLRSQAHEAARALDSALRATGYHAEVIGSHRWCPTGIAGRTCQPSGYNCSLHNYSLALDFDPFALGNPHFQRRFTSSDWSRTKFTAAQVAAVEAIRTNNGKQVWKWLGWAIGDTMHFEITVSIADLATGIDWDTVPGEGDEDVLRKGDTGRDVAVLQNLLRSWLANPPGVVGDPLRNAISAMVANSYPDGNADGIYGQGTHDAVWQFQIHYGLEATGVANAIMFSILAAHALEVRASSSSVDNDARTAAAAAKDRADKAHDRLDSAKAAL